MLFTSSSVKITSPPLHSVIRLECQDVLYVSTLFYVHRD